jgi:hypothetical protein
MSAAVSAMMISATVLLTPGTVVSRSMHQASGAITESMRSLRLRWSSDRCGQVHLCCVGVVVVEPALEGFSELGCLFLSRPRARSAHNNGSGSPAMRASSMDLPETPSVRVATDEILMLGSRPGSGPDLGFQECPGLGV